METRGTKGGEMGGCIALTEQPGGETSCYSGRCE